MASKYNVHEVKNNRFPDEETHYSITLIRNSNITLDDIAEEMNIMGSHSVGDVIGVVENLIRVVGNALGRGDSVTLDKFGSFWLSAGLKRPVTDPDSITGNDIQMKRICFKPAPELRNRVESLARFEKYNPPGKRKK